jgi:hypothetical protein
VATELIKMMVRRRHRITDSRVLVLGVTFKENCPDIRNSKVMDIVAELREFDCAVDVFDPVADPEDVMDTYGIKIITSMQGMNETYEGIVAAVRARRIQGPRHRSPYKAARLHRDDVKAYSRLGRVPLRRAEGRGAMTLIGVISDTHLSGPDRVSGEILASRFMDVELIIHAGDLVALLVLEALGRGAGGGPAVCGQHGRPGRPRMPSPRPAL